MRYIMLQTSPRRNFRICELPENESLLDRELDLVGELCVWLRTSLELTVLDKILSPPITIAIIMRLLRKCRIIRNFGMMRKFGIMIGKFSMSQKFRMMKVFGIIGKFRFV